MSLGSEEEDEDSDKEEQDEDENANEEDEMENDEEEGEEEEEEEDDSEEDDEEEEIAVKQPCILVFDSLGGSRARQARLCATLRKDQLNKKILKETAGLEGGGGRPLFL